MHLVMAVTILCRIGSQGAGVGSPDVGETDRAVWPGALDVRHQAEEEAGSDGGGKLHSHAHRGDGHKDLVVETEVEDMEKAYLVEKLFNRIIGVFEDLEPGGL